MDKKEYDKKRYQENKEKIKLQAKEYRDNNKEKIKEYRKTDNFNKSRRISDWKRNGVIHNDFNELYDYFINCKNCENCNIELSVGRFTTSTTRCLDHCHTTGEFRNVLCHYCNVIRG